MSAAEGRVEEWRRRQRARNRAILFVLLGLVVLFYVIALVRMGAI
jgi:hypothetical protein